MPGTYPGQLARQREVGQIAGGAHEVHVFDAWNACRAEIGVGGGPALERMATTGDPDRFDLPRPLLRRPGCDFSFSGLKTAVAQLVARFPAGALPATDAADIASLWHSTLLSSWSPLSSEQVELCHVEHGHTV